MPSPYRDLLAIPGTRAFVAAAFVGRISISMIGLGVVLLISATTGSYALAGAVAATEAAAMAVAAPQIGRLTDRFGQGRVLLPVAIVHGVALASLMACAELGAPYWALFGSAGVSGAAFPTVDAFVRSRWSHLLGGGRRLETAFSLESVLDEVIFVSGPVTVTVLATQVHRLAGLTAAGILTVTGSVALALQRRTEPPSGARDRRSGGTSAIRSPGFLWLILVFLALGAVFGSMEVSVVAFAEEEGARAAAGVVLGLQALGSLAAGLVYGARHWRAPIDRRFRLGLAGLVAGLAPLPLLPNVPVLAVVMFFGGLAISPTIIPGFGLVDRLVPSHARNEGFAWVTTAIGVGLAIGAPVGGQVVDAGGGRLGFVVPLAAGVAAAVIGVTASARLRVPEVQTGMKYSDGPTTEVEVHVDAPPARVWELVTDITLPARFGTELQQARWLDAEPALGARFVGRNRHPAAGEWETTCHVVAFEPERLFGWAVEDPAHPAATWRFELEPDQAGTRLRQWARMGPGPSGLTPVIRSMPEKEERIVARRLAEWRANMQATVQGIKALAERRGR